MATCRTRALEVDVVDRNPLAAMERTESDGVSVDLYHAASVGPVDVYWLSDGSTRDEGAVGSFMFRLNAGESSRVGTFLGHVFRYADGSGKTLASFRVMPHRPRFHLTDETIEAYKDEEMCRDSDPSCPDRAARNDCINAPGWMVMKCSRSCEACHLRDPQVRCRRDLLNVKQTPALVPGGVEAFFQSLLVSQRVQCYDSQQAGRRSGSNEGYCGRALGRHFGQLRHRTRRSEYIGHGVVPIRAGRRTKGRVDKYGEQSKIVSKSRTSENAWCTGHESHPSTVEVMSRIEKVTGIPTENYESFQVLRYQLGQEYRAHHDMSRTDNRLACGASGVYTFFLYLSDVEEGGETGFPLIKRPSGISIKVKPTRGTALVWPSVKSIRPRRILGRTVAALPVIKGTKFAANAWIWNDYSEPNILRAARYVRLVRPPSRKHGVSCRVASMA